MWAIRSDCECLCHEQCDWFRLWDLLYDSTQDSCGWSFQTESSCVMINLGGPFVPWEPCLHWYDSSWTVSVLSDTEYQCPDECNWFRLWDQIQALSFYVMINQGDPVIPRDPCLDWCYWSFQTVLVLSDWVPMSWWMWLIQTVRPDSEIKTDSDFATVHVDIHFRLWVPLSWLTWVILLYHEYLRHRWSDSDLSSLRVSMPQLMCVTIPDCGYHWVWPAPPQRPPHLTPSPSSPPTTSQLQQPPPRPHPPPWPLPPLHLPTPQWPPPLQPLPQCRLHPPLWETLSALSETLDHTSPPRRCR